MFLPVAQFVGLLLIQSKFCSKEVYAKPSSSFNGWSSNLITPAYTYPTRQLAGVCRVYVTDSPEGYGVLAGHLIVHIGFPTVCVAGLPNGQGLVNSPVYDLAVAC